MKKIFFETSLKNKVRILCFSVFILGSLVFFAISGYTLANRYKQDLEYIYIKSLNELSDYISNLEVTLEKGVYANTITQQQGLANKIMIETMGAKSSLEQLPLNYDEVLNINKFISQTSEYANFLSGNILRGKTISNEELENLKNLGSYAKSVNLDLINLIQKINSNPLNIKKLSNDKSRTLDLKKTGESFDFKMGFKEIDDGFADYPSLIYDGPFSDHLTRMTSKFLEGKSEISLEDAKNVISDKLFIEKNNIEYLSDIEGNLPCYKFKTPIGETLITKFGGYIKSIMAEPRINQINLDFDRAQISAQVFNRKLGLYNLKERYYMVSNGVCTINYAFCKDNVIYYKDLIKVGVSLENGSIVSFDATGYLMNHITRDNPTCLISENEARKNVSKRLEIIRSTLAYIPTKGSSEALCYEFECKGENKDRVLVYINTQTGLEEQIYILMESDNGTLVM